MIAAALIMGFAGSLHCIGMCSPLAMAVSNLNRHAVLNRTVYNAGRIATYGLLGIIIGSVTALLPFSKFQNVVSILLGVILLFVGAGLLNVNIPVISNPILKLTSLLKKLFSKSLIRKNYKSVFFLGILNGLLPCGLVWIALAYAATLQSPFQSFAFMMLFGAGTLPVMLGLTGILPGVLRRINVNVRQVTSGMLIVSGILLIARVFIIHLPHQSSAQHNLIDIVLCK
ncbi:MAG TPA: sulfite exporter TauE/SafE family protein [Chryseolinea sp.]